jgi:hypothetical protein
VSGFFSSDLEVSCETSLGNHVCGIAANCHWHTGFEMMMIIQGKAVWVFRDGAEVVRNLAIVFAKVFEIQFKGAIGDGAKIDHANLAVDIT